MVVSVVAEEAAVVAVEEAVVVAAVEAAVEAVEVAVEAIEDDQSINLDSYYLILKVLEFD